MSAGQMSVGQMSVGQMSIGQMSVGQMSVGQMSVGQMSVDQMSVGQMSVGQMSVGQMSVGHACRLIVSRSNDFQPKDVKPFNYFIYSSYTYCQQEPLSKPYRLKSYYPILYVCYQFPASKLTPSYHFEFKGLLGPNLKCLCKAATLYQSNVKYFFLELI
jgi:hypothetical protein